MQNQPQDWRKWMLLIGLCLSAQSCSLLQPFFAPILKPESARGSLRQSLMVSARLQYPWNQLGVAGASVRAYLWRAERWELVTTLHTDKQGWAWLTLPLGSLPVAGKYFVGWRRAEDDASPLVISQIEVTP